MTELWSNGADAPDFPDLEEAKRAQLRSLNADPSSLRAHCLLGKLYLRSNENLEAAKRFQLALQSDPKILPR
ncbi:MAG: hypothetical protein JO217_08590 [Acidobacteriaceae bacterium]|nr:hypothetical protein [Acidobacteriaceae bacterium]MBV9442736.1 hypothetical protein [Acidobacteriaceae bacterium]